MDQQTTGGTLCALCGSYFIGSHACSAHAPDVHVVDARRPYPDSATLREILVELRAIRSLLEARS